MTEYSGIWKPTAGAPAKKLAGSCEVTNLKLASGGGAAFVSIYDAVDESGATEANLKWVLDASTQDADRDSFSGLVFTKGVYAKCDQGADFNPVICIATRKYTP